MRVLFCKISAMKYYKGVVEGVDEPHNGGKYVEENGFGVEEFNFDPVEFDDKSYCLGFVETKTSKNGKKNELHIEKINGCELMKNELCVDDVLVIWCATILPKETRIVGWYKNATVFRDYQSFEFDDGYIQDYNVIAEAENCTLLPHNKRLSAKWTVPVARYTKSYGFGQALLWYATDSEAQSKVAEIVKNIEEYDGENDLYKYPDYGD